MDKLLKKTNLNYLFEMSFFIIILIGIVGNATNILVLSRKTMRKSLSFQLFLYLSIIDLAFLTQTGVELFLKYLFDIEVRESSMVFCKLNTFLSYFLMQTRNVFSMCITLSYLYEISKFNLKTLKKKSNNYQIRRESSNSLGTKIHKTLLATVCALFLINFHFILFLNLNLNVDSDVDRKTINFLEVKTFNLNITVRAECSPYRHKFYLHFLRNIWVWIDMIIYFLVPFSVNFIAFFFIFFYIKRLNGRYLALLNIENYKSNTHIYLKRMRKNRRIVWRLFTLNAYFFFSSLPSYVSYYSLILTNSHLILNYFYYLFFYSNNSLNFLFYGLTSQKYRCELQSILGCGKVEANTKLKKFGSFDMANQKSKRFSTNDINNRLSVDKYLDEENGNVLLNLNHLKEVNALKCKIEHFEKLLAQKKKELSQLK
jgi:hypothetical protein